jgi:hypothetical protein
MIEPYFYTDVMKFDKKCIRFYAGEEKIGPIINGDFVGFYQPGNRT